MFQDWVMTFWNVQNVADKLVTGEVSEKNAFACFALIGLFVTLFMSPVLQSPGRHTDIEIIETISSILVFSFGLLSLYLLCGEKHFSVFFKLFFCLSIPISVRILSFSTVFLVVIFASEAVPSDWIGDSRNSRILEGIFGQTVQFIYFYRMWYWMRYVTRQMK